MSVDGKLLVDGGTLNNLPVDVVKDMGANLLIAVPLLTPAVKKADLQSILGIAGRSISIMIEANESRNMSLADMLVAPDLSGLTSGDFHKYEEFRKRGYEAAEKKKRFLETLTVTEEEWRAYVDARARKRRPGTIAPKFVAVEGIEGKARQDIQKKLDADLSGHPLDTKKLETSLTRIAGYGPYQSASYGFVGTNEIPGMVVDVQPKSYGPPFLNTGINIEGSDTSEIRFGIGGRLTFMNFGAPYAEWRTDFTVGLQNLLSSEYYWRVRGSRWFLAPRAFISATREDVYDGKRRIAQFDLSQRGFGGDVGFGGGRFSEIRIGYEFNHVNATISTGPQIPTFGRALQAFRARWIYDSEDSPVIPRRGIYSQAEIRWNFITPAGTTHFGSVEERLTVPKAFGDRYIALATLAGGSNLGPSFAITEFALGGPLSLSALGRGQLRGDHYYYAGLAGLRAFSTDRSSVFNRVYGALGYEVGQAFASDLQPAPIHDGVLGIISETPVGAVFLGGALGTDGNRKIFFRIGKIF